MNKNNVFVGLTPSFFLSEFEFVFFPFWLIFAVIIGLFTYNSI